MEQGGSPRHVGLTRAMRILLLADLHCIRAWYEWLTVQAPKYDLVSIAGDLTDAFANDEAEQIRYLLDQWLPSYRRTGIPLATCSGNHDDPEIPWTTVVHPDGVVIGDGETRPLTLRSGEAIVVTTCPNNRWGGDALLIELWERGARLRDSGKAPWLILHHEPPWDFSTPESLSSFWLKVRLAQYHPDFVACGHFHEAGNFPFAARIEKVWCFNAGQRLDAPRPHHIVLDLVARTATRHWMVPVRGTLSWFSKSETLSF